MKPVGAGPLPQLACTAAVSACEFRCTSVYCAASACHAPGRGQQRPGPMPVDSHADGTSGEIREPHRRSRSAAPSTTGIRGSLTYIRCPNSGAAGGERVASNHRGLAIDTCNNRYVKTFEDLFAELAIVPAPGRPTAPRWRHWTAGFMLWVRSFEEAGEVWLAAEHESNDALAEEISQLLYWTQSPVDCPLDAVYRKL